MEKLQIEMQSVIDELTVGKELLADQVENLQKITKGPVFFESLVMVTGGVEVVLRTASNIDVGMKAAINKQYADARCGESIILLPISNFIKFEEDESEL